MRTRVRYPDGMPSFDKMIIPTLQALLDLGGTATVEEIQEAVVQRLNLHERVLNAKHGGTATTEVNYRMHWSRTYLNKYGLLDNPKRGTWTTSVTQAQIESLDPAEIVRVVRAKYQRVPADAIATIGTDIEETQEAFVDYDGVYNPDADQDSDAARTSNWFEDDDSDEDDFEIKEYDITASPNDFNMSTMVSFIESGAVKIPGFQRNYVWDLKRASKLIESIIIGLPIPQIFLYEESRNRFLVIDGQQRLMSIYYFHKQRFPRKEKRIELRRMFDELGTIPNEVLQDDNYFVKFNLKLPSKLPQANTLNKQSYGTLGESKTTFDLRTVRNIIIKQNAPDPSDDDSSSIFEIFNRLNTGGVNLKPQEIRTSLYHSPFYEMLYRVNIDERWRRLLGFEEPDLHMKDVELLLRAFAMVIWGGTYKPSMTRFLNIASKRAKTFSAEKVQYLSNLFSAFLTACEPLEPNAFMSTLSMKVNVSFIEAVFVAHCGNAFTNENLLVPEVDPLLLEKLKSDERFMSAAQSDTASSANVAMRLQRARAILVGGTNG